MVDLESSMLKWKVAVAIKGFDQCQDVSLER